MKYGFNSLGILITLTFGYGSVFGADIPDEIKELRDKAIADSKEVCMSAETLKTNYTVLETKEDLQTATYKVADMPRKGVQATVVYRVNQNDVRNIYRDAGESPRKKDGEEYKEWRAALYEKQLNFPKPYPESVVCVEEKAGVQTKYVFEKGALSVYLRHFDELTQVAVMKFPREEQASHEFYRVKNGSATGLMYSFDGQGNILETADYGPPSAERRSSIRWSEYSSPGLTPKELKEYEEAIKAELKKILGG